MAPSGGYKGVGSALLVEVMAACLAGATPGIEASTFGTNAGGPPKTGQCFIAIDPDATSGGAFAARMATVLAALTAEDGARLPGAKKAAARVAAARDGIVVDRAHVRYGRGAGRGAIMSDATGAEVRLPGMPLRPPDEVMRLARMGAAHPTRLSFLRTLLRRVEAERWRFSRPVWNIGEDGYGHAVYRSTRPTAHCRWWRSRPTSRPRTAPTG